MTYSGYSEIGATVSCPQERFYKECQTPAVQAHLGVRLAEHCNLSDKLLNGA